MNERPLSEKVVSPLNGRLWVHADEQPKEVVAGILGLFSESRSGFRSCSRIRSLQL